MESLITDAWKWFSTLEECYNYVFSVVGGTGAVFWIRRLGKWGVKPRSECKN